MLKKKALWILVAVFLVGLFAGGIGRLFLSSSSELSVEDQRAVKAVLVGYFTAWQAEKPDQMYGFLSAEDRAIVSQDDYVRQFNEYPIIPLQYVVEQITQEADAVLAKVSVYWPGIDEDVADKRQETFYLVREKTWKIVEKKSLAK